MTRGYYSDTHDYLTQQGAKTLRSKILAFWHSRGEKRVEVNLVFYEFPKPHYAVRSNIVSLGLLGRGVRT